MTTLAWPRHTGYRFPAAIIRHALWLWLYSASRLVSAWWRSCSLPAASSSAPKPCGRGRANSAGNSPIRSVVAFRGLATRWHLDEVVLEIAGVKHWLWRAVGQTGIVLDVLVQRRRDTPAAQRMLPSGCCASC